jgi:DNA polymerase-3 subunit delta'
MPIVPLYGHHSLRERILKSLKNGTLPASFLFQGARGIGKQRLALWVAQAIICDEVERPCGVCKQCRMMTELQHPDVYWFYPKPRLKTPDPTPNEVLEDYRESTSERVEQHGLYEAPSGSDGLFIATVRTIVQRASLAPAIARHKVFIVGDAERMVSQEGADQAANAFLKLLEEPPADTTIILTSSEPGALLPTIRSRVVAFRCAPLTDADMRALLEDPLVSDALNERGGIPKALDARLALAAGAPGSLLGVEALNAALDSAQDILRAAERRGAEQYEVALAQGVSNARGSFADTLKALNILLRNRAQEAISHGDTYTALRASRGIEAVARAQARAEGNVNPQLVTSRLLRELSQ